MTKNSVVLITGASSGIGRASAIEFSRHGHDLILASRNMKESERTARLIWEENSSINISRYKLDLASFKSINHFCREIHEEYHKIDILINNAGIFPYNKELGELNLPKAFIVNYLGPVLLTENLLPILKAGSGKRIINISSDAHKSAKLPIMDGDVNLKCCGFPLYAQTKLALCYYTKYRGEMLLDEDITMNALHPGMVRTAIMLGPKKIFNTISKSINALFAVEPEIPAKTVYFLANSDSIETVSGEYFYKNRPRKMAVSCYKKEILEDFWEWTKDKVYNRRYYLQ